MYVIPYIKYEDLNNPFYTLDETCGLFGMNRIELRKYAEKYKILPERNELGQAVFSTYNLRRLHNLIYIETHPRADTDSLWND